MFPSDSWMRFPIYYISQYLQKSWVVKQPKGLVKSDSWHPDVMLVTHTHIEGSWGPSGVWDASPIKSWTTGGRDGRYGSEEPEHLSAEDPWRSTIVIYADIYDVDWCCYFSMLLTSLAVRTEACMKECQEGRKQCIYCTFDSSTTDALYSIDVDSKATPPQMPPSKGLGFLTHSLSFQYQKGSRTSIIPV